MKPHRREASARERLGQALRAVLAHRHERTFWHELNDELSKCGEPTVAFETLMKWKEGSQFPKSRTTQIALAKVAGGLLGGDISSIPDPAFRYYKPGKDYDMRRNARIFPNEAIKEDGGRTVHKSCIICSQCNVRDHYLRRGEMEPEDFFAKHGWLVGKSNEYDLCPDCSFQRKVIKMQPKNNDIIIPASAPDVRKIKLTERSVIMSTIGDNFDEDRNCYKAGWSDLKIATDLDVPIEWVKDIRESACPGSDGDNPDMVGLLVGFDLVNSSIKEYDKRVDRLMTSVGAVEALFKKVENEQRHVRTESTKLESDRKSIKQQISDLVEKLDRLTKPKK